jgi:hypothetical protein
MIFSAAKVVLELCLNRVYRNSLRSFVYPFTRLFTTVEAGITSFSFSKVGAWITYCTGKPPLRSPTDTGCCAKALTAVTFFSLPLILLNISC